MSNQKSVSWQQKTFEKMIRARRKGKVDFSIDEKTGYYNDKQLKLINMGFRMGLTAAREHHPGKFVIGKIIPETNVPVFGNTPRIHSNFSTVNTELERLQEEHPEETFIAYASVVVRKPRNK